MRKKIAWISDCFVDTDIYIIPLLCASFDIEWHILTRRGKPNDFEREIAALSGHAGLSIIRHSTYRVRDPRTFLSVWSMVRQIKRGKPAMVYAGLCGYPHALPAIRLLLGTGQVVAPVHNVSTPKGAVNYRFAKWNTAQVLNTYRNFHTFSRAQCALLQSLRPGKKVFMTPFLLKDYGPTTATPGELITFLNFGIIRHYKRIDVLIEAAQAAFERTGQPFIVEIAGACDNWEEYQRLIRYPELFRLCIRRIGNAEIPDLFGRCHYFVAPYQDIAQSGSAIVSINYDKPIIASDLEAFRETVQDGVSGYLMRPASVQDLTDIMVRILREHRRIYPQLVAGLRAMKEREFAPSAIVAGYVDMFNHLD